MPFLLISNYLKREQLAKEKHRKGKIRNASSTGAEFLVADHCGLGATKPKQAFNSSALGNQTITIKSENPDPNIAPELQTTSSNLNKTMDRVLDSNIC